jgi:hypothetical protein
MTIDINLILQICLVLLVVSLTIGVVMFVLILLDIRQITRKIKQELKALNFLVDILDFVVSGFHLAKKKIGRHKCCEDKEDE